MRNASKFLVASFVVVVGTISTVNLFAQQPGTILPAALPVVVNQPIAPASPMAGGPGTEMTKIINRMGMGSDCGRCKSLAAQMDQGGPSWVMQNREYVVQRTISNATNLGHRMGPVRRAGVRWMVGTSVRRSR